MKHVRQLAAIALTALLLPIGQAATALTITNRDADSMNLTVVEQSGQQGVELSIDTQQTLDGFCPRGCVITLGNGASDTFEGTEVVSIQNGQFIVDE